MPNIGGLLTQKIGPLPGFVWALGIGGLVFLLGPKLLKGSSTTAGAATPGGFDPQSFAAGFSQGAQYQPGSGNSAPAPVATTLPPQPNPIPPVKGGFVRGQNPGGMIDTMDQMRHGVGGVGRSAAVGSRSADPHAYFHPSMKLQPRYPHFVRAGVGGAAAAHTAAVHALAHQAEIHPARLHMLNPRPHRFVRVA